MNYQMIRNNNDNDNAQNVFIVLTYIPNTS